MKLTLFILVFIISLNSIRAQLYVDDNGTITSIKVQEITTQEILFSQGENLRLMPASLTKVVTTATALELLGAGYTYQTDFFYRGEKKGTKLYGDLIVTSYGDPTLGSRYFEETAPEMIFSAVADGLKKAGIQSIVGSLHVIADQIGYSAPRLWEDMGNYYGASPQGFNWRDNTAEVTLSSGAVGTKCRVVSIDPDIKPYSIRCEAVAAAHNNDSAYVYGIGKMQQWWIEGSIPKNRSLFKIKAALPDPRAAFKKDLIEYLNKNGIEIGEKRPVGASKEKKNIPICTYHSPPLSEIIKVVNQKSNNLFADQLLLTIAKELKGQPTWDYGNLAVREFWEDKIDFNHSFRLRDGSGLTPKNLVSAKGMVQLLNWMNQNSGNFSFYAESLARGGESGTLRSVFKHPDLEGRIIGKSGSFEGVLGYCGYATTVSGKKTAFCIIANNYLVPTKKIRITMDEFMTKVVLEN
ncbi:D-alanyl-D-alanine carboxypeptidase/D-alanyl-D-alanine endopeptidase [Saccharicrinis sp. 156]|uniref:D-alanyl-D-alanine carboxypeptidase/D-alanyl-D-alanine endopeptidase n=1 Tax=Saccharicrinis sp. 156 TaxID=3417574 RepID=UPI003D34D99F